MSTVALVVTAEERTEREQEGAQLVAQATALVVHDQESFAAAAAWRRDVIAPLKKKIADTFRPRIRQADELHKGLLADERRFLAPVEQADRLVNGRLIEYDTEVKRLRRVAEESAQRERERLEREARDVAQAEQQRRQREEEERRLASAIAAEQAGDHAAAERIIEAPIVAPTITPVAVFTPPIAAPPPPVAAGLSFRTTYRATVTDLGALVRAIAAGQAPLSAVKADEVALNQMARALKGALTYPGVRVDEDRTTAQRA